MRWKLACWVAMLSYVHFAGWLLCLMAAFSAGRPKASQPIGCSTSKPFMREKRATTSP